MEPDTINLRDLASPSSIEKSLIIFLTMSSMGKHSVSSKIGKNI